MPLSSSSTLAQVQAAYDDNASYREVASVAMARAFVTACRILLRRTPSMAVHGKQTIAISLDVIQQEMDQATKWIASMGASGVAPVLCPAQDFRG